MVFTYKTFTVFLIFICQFINLIILLTYEFFMIFLGLSMLFYFFLDILFYYQVASLLNSFYNFQI